MLLSGTGRDHPHHSGVLFGDRRNIYGMMSPPWAFMLYLTIISSAIGYKLPLSDQSFLTGPHNIGKSSSSPLVWEWEDKSDKTLLSLIRTARDVIDKKKTESQKDVKYPTKAEKVSKSPLDKIPDIIPAKSSYTTPQVMAQGIEDVTIPLHELDHTLTEKENTSEAETTQTYKSLTPEIKKIATQMKFTSTQEQLSTPSPTKSKDLPVHTKSTPMETTTLIQIHSTNEKLLSSIPVSTSDKVVEETSTVPSKIPTETSSKPTETPAKPTTHGKTTGWIQDFKSSSTALGIVTTTAPVTHISTTSEDKILNQYLMKQCMLTILILAVVCTIFIITTIALAAKLSTMKQKQKLRHPATYTEMRCISSLLPESEQQNKPKRLKTFAAVEESDGDNTTLNSFLPDH